MNEVTDVRIVRAGETTYERFAMAIVTVAFVAIVFSVGTLFGWVPVSGHVGSVPVAPTIGFVVFALGAATGILGLLSRWGGIHTTPDRTPGLTVGLVQGFLWFATAGLFLGTTLGFGRIGWLVASFGGAVAGYLTIGMREDAGATLPAAAFICLVGTLFVTGVIDPAWTWEPEGFDAIIPGTLALPLLTIGGSLLASWAGASAYEGFGSRGRQNGAFLMISLVVLLVLSVLVFLLIFVFERGITVVLENFTVGGGTLLVGIGTAVFVLYRFGNATPAAADGADKTVAFVTRGVGIVLGLVGAGLAFMIATGQSISGYSVTVEPTAGVGAISGLLGGAILLAVLRRSKTAWEPDSARGRRVHTGFQLLTGVLVGTALVQMILWSELAVLGIAVVALFVHLAAAVAIGSLLVNGIDRLVDADLRWVPPLSSVAVLGLWAVVIGCLHAVITGRPFAVGTIEIIATGTIDWPFVMNPSQGLGIQKGVMPAMFGTIWIVIGAVVFAVPLAVGAAVFLTEYAEDSIFTRMVDVATNGLWSTPSIVFGLFGLAFLVPRFGGGPSIFTTQLVLGFMLLPLVLITSREAMKSVPDEYRDASAALGVSKWDTIRSVVIPAAMPGVITGAILGVGRIAGETAPLLLVLNGPNFPNSGPGILSSFTVDVGLEPPFVHVANPALLERASALPYQLYAIITAGVGAEESFGWGTALVLLGVVLAFFAMGIASRRYFRKKLHQ